MYATLPTACWVLLTVLASLTAASPVRENRQFVGYLISTFADVNPTVQWYLSKGNDPSNYSFLNRGQPVLKSTVGTKAVRDVFLATNSARNEWFMIGTDLDVKAPGFSWDKVTRSGSRRMVVWKSPNLLDWSEATLPLVEADTAGMLWAPSAVWDDATSQYYVFWSSMFYSASDTSHQGDGSLKRIRYSTTRDFANFSAPQDYLNLPKNSIIDQEFVCLGQAGHYARFYKDETAGSHVVIETSSDGLFGKWTRLGNVRPEGQREGAAAFADNTTPGKYYVFLDNYTEYLPFETSNISTTPWTVPKWPNFPSGLKHGSVTPLTQQEYDAILGKYPPKTT